MWPSPLEIHQVVFGDPGYKAAEEAFERCSKELEGGCESCPIANQCEAFWDREIAFRGRLGKSKLKGILKRLEDFKVERDRVLLRD